MPAPFKCKECGFETRVKDQLAGKRIKCPKCQAVGQVGGSSAASPAKPAKKAKPQDSEDSLMAVKLDSFQDAEVAEGEVLDESQAVKKPKAKKKKQKKGATLPPQIKMAAIGFSLVSVLVLAGLVYSVGPMALEFLSKSTESSKEDGADPENPAAENAAPGNPAPENAAP